MSKLNTTMAFSAPVLGAIHGPLADVDSHPTIPWPATFVYFYVYGHKGWVRVRTADTAIKIRKALRRV
jgi:hypothetical protein